jgi:hypothetical protein
MNDYVYQGFSYNRRLESMLIVLESTGKDLERSTKRFKEANDTLNKRCGYIILPEGRE